MIDGRILSVKNITEEKVGCRIYEAIDPKKRLNVLCVFDTGIYSYEDSDTIMTGQFDDTYEEIDEEGEKRMVFIELLDEDTANIFHFYPGCSKLVIYEEYADIKLNDCGRRYGI